MISNTVPNGADFDIDSATNNLTATVVGTGPAHAAAFTLNPDGSFSYTPTADYNGPDSFTYKLNDGWLDSDTATVNITVSAVNDAPVAQDDAFTTAEDTALSGNVIANTVPNGADSDIDTSQAQLDRHGGGTGPAHAAAFTLNPDGSFSYTPNADYNGPDSFTYQANDGTADSNTATVNITVVAVNDAPVGEQRSLTTARTRRFREVIAGTVPTGGLRQRYRDQLSDRPWWYRARRTPPRPTSIPTAASPTPRPPTTTGRTRFTYQANDGTAGLQHRHRQHHGRGGERRPGRRQRRHDVAEDTAMSGNVSPIPSNGLTPTTTPRPTI